MKDRLEAFVRQHREALDDELPGLGVWAGIQKELHQKEQARKISYLKIIRMVAAVSFLVAAGAALGIYPQNPGESSQMASRVSISDLSEEYAEMEAFYKQQLSEKRQLVTRFVNDQTLIKDLDQQEAFLLELENELKEAPEEQREVIIHAIIKNYQTRLSLLEKVLHRVQSANQNYRDNAKESFDI